jgi:hypothetical protein
MTGEVEDWRACQLGKVCCAVVFCVVPCWDVLSCVVSGVILSCNVGILTLFVVFTDDVFDDVFDYYYVAAAAAAAVVVAPGVCVTDVPLLFAGQESRK